MIDDDEDYNPDDSNTKPSSQIYEQGWYLWSESKRGPWQAVFVRDGRNMTFSLAGDDASAVHWSVEDSGFFREGRDPEEPDMPVEDVAVVSTPGSKVVLSPWGYAIAADGTVYSLTRRYCHGLIATLLFPKEAFELGYQIPTSDFCDVFHYQQAEFALARKGVPLIRISTGGWGGAFNISKNDEPATPAQVEALRLTALAAGLNLRDEVHTNHGDMTLKKALKYVVEGWSHD